MQRMINQMEAAFIIVFLGLFFCGCGTNSDSSDQCKPDGYVMCMTDDDCCSGYCENPCSVTPFCGNMQPTCKPKP